MLILGTPLVVVPWLGHRTSTAWVQSLVGKLSSHILQLYKERKKEMQILGPHLKSTEVQTLGMGPSNLFQQQLSRWLMFPNIWEPGKEILLPSWGHGSVLAAPGSGAPRCTTMSACLLQEQPPSQPSSHQPSIMVPLSAAM